MLRVSEAEENEDIYDQLACWCETNDIVKEKTEGIADAEAKIIDLTTKIDELTAAAPAMKTAMKK